MNITPEQRLIKILDRGIIKDILPSKELFIKEALKRKLRFYIGFDATAPTLHLSHAKNFMVLEEFRQLGHEVIVLFGDFTARIGDPTDRRDARSRLSEEDIKKNVAAWRKQIDPLMDFRAKENPPIVKYNSAWQKKLNFEDLIDLASNFTAQQLLERDMFQKRLKENRPIHMHELFYPMMQGFDSVAMDVDVELCGTDQTFNALAGRTLQKRLNHKEKFVTTVNLMEDPETGQLMSKSKSIGVFLGTSAEEMFRSIMAQPDSMTELLLINNTRIELEKIKDLLKRGPLEAKETAAFEITKILYGEKAAENAREEFVRKVRKKEVLDEDFKVIKFKPGTTLKHILVSSKLVTSNSEFSRLVSSNAIRNIDNQASINSLDEEARQGRYRVGKKRFIRLESEASPQ